MSVKRVTPTKEELPGILRKHRLWLEDRPSGERAHLTGAHLAGANLAGADLTGARVNWQSHSLLGEILWRAADTIELQKYAAFAARRTNWCWAEFLAHGKTCPEVAWALDPLRPWVQDGDNAPDSLREKQKATP